MYVLAFSTRLCDVLGRVEGEASVPRVSRTARREVNYESLSYVVYVRTRIKKETFGAVFVGYVLVSRSLLIVGGVKDESISPTFF